MNIIPMPYGFDFSHIDQTNKLHQFSVRCLPSDTDEVLRLFKDKYLQYDIYLGGQLRIRINPQTGKKVTGKKSEKNTNTTLHRYLEKRRNTILETDIIICLDGDRWNWLPENVRIVKKCMEWCYSTTSKKPTKNQIYELKKYLYTSFNLEQLRSLMAKITEQHGTNHFVRYDIMKEAELLNALTNDHNLDLLKHYIRTI
jgi:hypothetical protein